MFVEGSGRDLDELEVTGWVDLKVVNFLVAMFYKKRTSWHAKHILRAVLRARQTLEKTYE